MTFLPAPRSARAAARSPRARLAAVAALLVAGSVAAVVVIGPRRAQIVETVEAWGTLAPVGFVVLYAVATLLLAPGSVLTVAAGVLFGPLTGAILAVAGGLVGSTGAFLAGRRLGRGHVERLSDPRIQRLDAWLQRYGLLALVYIRFVPLVPYPAMNYAAGMTALPPRDFVLGTALGLVPGAVAYATFGGRIDEPTSPAFVAAIGLMIALGLSGPLLQRWRQNAESG